MSKSGKLIVHSERSYSPLSFSFCGGWGTRVTADSEKGGLLVYRCFQRSKLMLLSNVPGCCASIWFSQKGDLKYMLVYRSAIPVSRLMCSGPHAVECIWPHAKQLIARICLSLNLVVNWRNARLVVDKPIRGICFCSNMLESPECGGLFNV